MGELRDISHIHRRHRSQTAVDLLDKLRNKADSGELVGVIALSVDKYGTWRHDRDMFNSDVPAMIGYLEMLKTNLVHKYLTGSPLTQDD